MMWVNRLFERYMPQATDVIKVVDLTLNLEREAAIRHDPYPTTVTDICHLARAGVHTRGLEPIKVDRVHAALMNAQAKGVITDHSYLHGGVTYKGFRVTTKGRALFGKGWAEL